MRGTGSKAKGSGFEREIARLTGGKRTPLSGAGGGNDITHQDDALWSVWGIEAKRRAKLPTSVMSWLAQAEYALPIGSQRKPCVVAREDRGRTLFIAYFEDVDQVMHSLADLGQSHRVKPLARELERIAAELRSLS